MAKQKKLKNKTNKSTDMAEIYKEDAEFIKNSLKQKVDIDEFAALERRVVLLEKRR